MQWHEQSLTLTAAQATNIPLRGTCHESFQLLTEHALLQQTDLGLPPIVLTVGLLQFGMSQGCFRC